MWGLGWERTDLAWSDGDTGPPIFTVFPGGEAEGLDPTLGSACLGLHPS